MADPNQNQTLAQLINLLSQDTNRRELRTMLDQGHLYFTEFRVTLIFTEFRKFMACVFYGSP